MVSVLLAEPRPRFRCRAISGGGTVSDLKALETLWCADELALASRPGSRAGRPFMMRLPASAHPDGVVRMRCRSAGFEVGSPGWRGEAHPAGPSGTGP